MNWNNLARSWLTDRPLASVHFRNAVLIVGSSINLSKLKSLLVRIFSIVLTPALKPPFFIDLVIEFLAGLCIMQPFGCSWRKEVEEPPPMVAKGSGGGGGGGGSGRGDKPRFRVEMGGKQCKLKKKCEFRWRTAYSPISFRVAWLVQTFFLFG